MTEVHAGATLIAEQNWAHVIPCKASLEDAEQVLAAIFLGLSLGLSNL